MINKIIKEIEFLTVIVETHKNESYHYNQYIAKQIEDKMLSDIYYSKFESLETRLEDLLKLLKKLEGDKNV